MTNITVFSPRTGSHTYREGQVWQEYNGPTFLGMYRNCVGKAISVEWPAQLAWRYPLLQACLEAGLFDATNRLQLTYQTRLFLLTCAREHSTQEREAEAAQTASNAYMAEPLLRGSWLVRTKIVGSPWHDTVHPTKAAAFAAAQRPADCTQILQGDYILHRSGWVTAKGREYLRWEAQD